MTEAKPFPQRPDTLARIIAAHKNARPQRENIAWWNTHQDLSFVLNELERVRAAAVRIAFDKFELKGALRGIIAIPNNSDGGDWDEIQQARDIAELALREPPPPIDNDFVALGCEQFTSEEVRRAKPVADPEQIVVELYDWYEGRVSFANYRAIVLQVLESIADAVTQAKAKA